MVRPAPTETADPSATERTPTGAIESTPADELRRLADLVLSGTLDPVESKRLATDLAALAADYPLNAPIEVQPDKLPYRERSPFVGTANAAAPPMKLERVEATEPALRGRVVLSSRHSGPAGVAHGGIVAGLFDELFGSLASVAEIDGAAVTATLETRFRKPTPIGTELVFEAGLSRRSSRRLKMHATCVANDAVTATAEALMVIVA